MNSIALLGHAQSGTHESLQGELLTSDGKGVRCLGLFKKAFFKGDLIKGVQKPFCFYLDVNY